MTVPTVYILLRLPIMFPELFILCYFPNFSLQLPSVSFVLHNYLANTLSGLLIRLLQELKQAGILTEDLCMPDPKDETQLEAVYRGLCRLPNVEGSRRRRIDIFTVSWDCKGAALLHYTVRPPVCP